MQTTKPAKIINDIFSISENLSGCRFVGLTYENAQGELANHVVNIGFDYENALRKDLNHLLQLEKVSIDFSAIEKQALSELIDSLRERINKIDVEKESKKKIQEILNKKVKTQDDLDELNMHKDIVEKLEEDKPDIWEHPVPGIKMHKDTGDIFVYGSSVSKKVIVEGEKKETKKKPLTIAKDKFREELKADRYRQFKISPDNLINWKFNGETFEIKYKV